MGRRDKQRLGGSLGRLLKLRPGGSMGRRSKQRLCGPQGRQLAGSVLKHIMFGKWFNLSQVHIGDCVPTAQKYDFSTFFL